MSRPKKSATPVASGSATGVIGLFEAEDRAIKLDDRGYITITRLGRTTIRVYIEDDGNIVISGENPISIAPGAANMIRIP